MEIIFCLTEKHAHTQENNACKSRRGSQSVANDTSSGVSTHEDAPNTAREDKDIGYKVFCCKKTTGFVGVQDMIACIP